MRRGCGGGIWFEGVRVGGWWEEEEVEARWWGVVGCCEEKRLSVVVKAVWMR